MPPEPVFRLLHLQHVVHIACKRFKHCLNALHEGNAFSGGSKLPCAPLTASLIVPISGLFPYMRAKG